MIIIYVDGLLLVLHPDLLKHASKIQNLNPKISSSFLFFFKPSNLHFLQSTENCTFVKTNLFCDTE